LQWVLLAEGLWRIEEFSKSAKTQESVPSEDSPSDDDMFSSEERDTSDKPEGSAGSREKGKGLQNATTGFVEMVKCEFYGRAAYRRIVWNAR
jgi:hypothetical protein